MIACVVCATIVLDRLLESIDGHAIIWEPLCTVAYVSPHIFRVTLHPISGRKQVNQISQHGTATEMTMISV